MDRWWSFWQVDIWPFYLFLGFWGFSSSLTTMVLFNGFLPWCKDVIHLWQFFFEFGNWKSRNWLLFFEKCQEVTSGIVLGWFYHEKKSILTIFSVADILFASITDRVCNTRSLQFLDFGPLLAFWNTGILIEKM